MRNRSFAILFSGIILSAATLMAFGGAAGARRPFQSQQITTPPAQAPSQQSPQISTPLPQQPPLAIPQAPPHPTLAIVVLDAAHGGTDAGARGTTGINESDIALEFARNVKPALEAQGFRVVETREENEDPSFDERLPLRTRSAEQFLSRCTYLPPARLGKCACIRMNRRLNPQALD